METSELLLCLKDQKLNETYTFINIIFKIVKGNITIFQRPDKGSQNIAREHICI